MSEPHDRNHPDPLADKKSERKVLLKGAGANFIGIAGKAIYPIFLFAAVRLYGSGAFGDYILAMAVVEAALRLALGGTADAVQMFVARRQANQDQPRRMAPVAEMVSGALWSTMFFVALVMGIVVVASGWASVSLWHKPQLATMLRIMVLALPGAALSALGVGATKGLMIMRHEVTINSFLRPSVLLAATVALEPLLHDGRGLAIAYLASYSLAGVAGIWAYAKHFDLKATLVAALRIRLDRAYLKFVVAQNLNTMLGLLNGQLDIIMLGSFVSSSAVGFYGVGNRIAANLRQVKLSFSGIYSPLVARYHAAGKVHELERTYWMIARWILLAVLPLFVIAVMYRNGLFRLFVGSTPYPTTFFVLLLVGPLLSCAYGLSGNMILMAGYSWVTLTNALIAFAINGTLNALLIPRMGLVGAALATMTAALVVTAAQLIEVRRLLGVRPPLGTFVKPAVAAIVTLGALAGTEWLIAGLALPFHILAGLASIAIFYALVWLLGMDPEDREGLAALRNKLKKRSKPAVPNAQ